MPATTGDYRHATGDSRVTYRSDLQRRIRAIYNAAHGIADPQTSTLDPAAILGLPK